MKNSLFEFSVQNSIKRILLKKSQKNICISSESSFNEAKLPKKKKVSKEEKIRKNQSKRRK